MYFYCTWGCSLPICQKYANLLNSWKQLDCNGLRLKVIYASLAKTLQFIVIFNCYMYICDPPQENREKAECTGTRTMTQRAKRVTIAGMCAYLISKTKSVMVDIVWQPKALV